MTKPRVQADMVLMWELCFELRRAIYDGIPKLRCRLDEVFRKFAQRRAFQGVEPDAVVDDFWEIMLEGEIICRYKARKNASLQSYLLSALFKHIIDENRRELRRRKGIEKLSRNDTPEPLAPNPEELTTRYQIQKLQHQMVSEGLRILGQTFPDDAILIRLKMKGIKNKVIAENGLISGKNELNESDLKKRYERAKKKLRIILERLCKQHEIDLKDFFTE